LTFPGRPSRPTRKSIGHFPNLICTSNRTLFRPVICEPTEHPAQPEFRILDFGFLAAHEIITQRRKEKEEKKYRRKSER
jgi:hypothetical protein